MSQIAEILKVALEKAKGEKIKRVWYEPINGPCMEMQGHAGGWMYEDENGEDVIGGYNAVEAIEAIITTAKLCSYSEYDAAHRRDRSRRRRGTAAKRPSGITTPDGRPFLATQR